MKPRIDDADDRPVEGRFCPHCIHTNLYRSRLRVWERPVVLLTGFRPYRCRRCCWRGWRWRFSPFDTA